MTNPPRLRLITFGGLSLELDGAPVSGPAAQRKRLALLALLAVSGERGLSRDKLLVLWPESDEDRARNSLNQLVHGIRRDSGDVILGSTELRLDPALISSDIGEFRAALANGDLAAAVELYRGPFLDGVYVRGADDFERWVESQRARLIADHLDALDRLLARAEQAADSADRVRWARLRAGADPLSARGARAYMEALVAAGDREAAMRHARVYFALVRSELSAEPDPGLGRYVEELALSPPAPVRTAAVARASAPEPARGPAPIATQRPKTRRWTLGYGIAAAALALLGVLGLASFKNRHRTRPDLVIVTPFENRTGDPSLEPFGLVIGNVLTQDLAAAGRMSVGDFGTVLAAMRQPGQGDIVRASGAGWAVRGQYRLRGDSLVVEARIVHGPNADLAMTIDPIVVPRGEEDRLLDRARQSVLGAMATLHDAPSEAWAGGPALGHAPQYRAQLEYAQGLDALSRGDVMRARATFRHAVELDTDFAAPKFELLAAHDARSDTMLASLNAGRDRLSQAQQMELNHANADSRHDLEGAYRWAERLVSLSPDDPTALLGLQGAAYNTSRFERAIAAFHSADRFPPWRGGSAILDINAHHVAGDFATALREAQQGRLRFPRNWGYCAKAIEQYAALGLVDQADSVITSCKSVRAFVDPGQPYWLEGRDLLAHGHVAAAQRVLARCIALSLDYAALHPERHLPSIDFATDCHFQRGDWRTAYERLRQALPTYSDQDKARLELGLAAAQLGDTATTLEMLRWNEQQADVDNIWYRAALLFALGRRDDALFALRKATETGSVAIMTHFIHNGRAFLPMRSDPAFAALLAPRR